MEEWAYGMIFSFDGSIGNTRAALVRAAAALAVRKGAPPLLPHQLALRSHFDREAFHLGASRLVVAQLKEPLLDDI